MTEKTDKKLYAISLLRQKANLLGRLPKRSDFAGAEVCLIKQKLGPWPRALETAGLKEPPAVTAAQKSREKRERTKKQRKKMLRQHLNDQAAFSDKMMEEET